MKFVMGVRLCMYFSLLAAMIPGVALLFTSHNHRMPGSHRSSSQGNNL